VIALYGEVLPTLPQPDPDVWNDVRQALLRARWRESWVRISKKRGRPVTREELLDGWKVFFEYVAKSKFLTGQAPSTKKDRPPFVADLEWLISPTNFSKVYEGKYHGEAAA
jgi:hypothetical protein